MTQHGSLKNSPTLHKLYRNLYGVILKKKKLYYFIDKLWEKPVVTDFQSETKEAFLKQVAALPKDKIREAVESVAKLDDAEIERVRRVISEEYQSFENFLEQTRIVEFLTATYNAGGQNALDKFNVEGVFDLRNQAVVDKLKVRANFLIRSVDETTKDSLAKLVSKGVDEGMDWQAIAKKLDEEFEGISSYRAELIARMESANAVNLAEIDFYRNNGITSKRWVLASSHKHTDICDECADQGDVPLEQPFISGDMAPPAHVNCACGMDTVLPDDFIENGPTWLGA